MRRLGVLAVAALLCVGAMGAAADDARNGQKIFAVGSEVYELMTSLYLSRGLALPSSSGPWNADELSLMLAAVDRSGLSGGEARLYDEIAEALAWNPSIELDDGMAFGFGMEAALEAYAHTNAADFPLETDWIRGYGERRPLWLGYVETCPAGHFYSYVSIQLGLNSGRVTDGVNDVYGAAFALNLPLSADALANIDMNFPYRALVAAGGSHWNLEAGRDRLSWGSGVTGNLMLGSELPYHQFVKFSTFYDSFKFTTLASFFPHPQDYGDTTQNQSVDGFKMLFAHRVEARFLDGRLGIALNESLVYQSATGTLDLRVLNPVGLYHNYYTRANANSLLGIELDAALVPGLVAYGQLAIDDSPFLEPSEPEANANPTAIGYLAGVKGAVVMDGGVLTASLEGAYTDPFLYLREAYDDADGTYGVGYDAALRVFNDGVQYRRYYLGYQYGNDAVVGDIRVRYRSFDRWSALFEGFLLVHGVMDMDSVWGVYTGSETVPHTPSTANPFDAGETGAVATSLVLSAEAGLELRPRLGLGARVDYVMTWNKGNVVRPMTMDAQLGLGLSWSL